MWQTNSAFLVWISSKHLSISLQKCFCGAKMYSVLKYNFWLSNQIIIRLWLFTGLQKLSWEWNAHNKHWHFNTHIFKLVVELNTHQTCALVTILNPFHSMREIHLKWNSVNKTGDHNMDRDPWEQPEHLKLLRTNPPRSRLGFIIATTVITRQPSNSRGGRAAKPL